MRYLRLILGVLMLGVGIYQYFFAYGTAVKFGPGEEVYYKSGATKPEAEAVGKSLQKEGYFSGTHPSSVQVVKKEPGYAVRFVVKDKAAEDASTVEAFSILGYRLSQDALGKQPVTVELCDGEFHTVKSVPMQDPGPTLTFKGSDLRYRPPVTEAQAKAVGEVLVAQDYFADDTKASVQLLSENGTFQIQFVVNDGAWDKAETVDAFATVGGALSRDALKGAKVRVDLCDDMYRVKKSFPAR